MLIEYDKKHNNYINLNKLLSSYYAECPEMNPYVFNFLMENGFDLNIPDKYGIYLLQYALFLNAYSFIHSIIQTGKIDLSVKIPLIPYESHRVDLEYCKTIKFDWQLISESKILVKYRTTYLHLAAKCPNSQIFKEFLDTKMFDINEADDLGNTPLIEACSSKIKDNIELLIGIDGVDFQHRNKEGQDALNVINPALMENDIVIQDKHEYFNMLLKHCPDTNQNHDH